MAGITRTHNIHVTPDMVFQGKREDCGKCPAARAIMANFEAELVYTTGMVTQWGTKHEFSMGQGHIARHSDELNWAIRRFDQGGVFEPGVYQITEEV